MLGDIMAFADYYDFDSLKNDAVDAVIQELEHQLSLEENSEVCQCQDCVLDMAAYALNQIKPSYRSTFTGIIYSQQLYNDEQRHNDITEAVKSAIAKISQNPLHNN